MWGGEPLSQKPEELGTFRPLPPMLLRPERSEHHASELWRSNETLAPTQQKADQISGETKIFLHSRES